MGTTSELLLELHKRGREVGVAEFQEWALAKVKERLPFDAALWAVGAITETGLIIHGMHLHRRPPEMLADYMPIWREDKLLAALLASPGKSISMSQLGFQSPQAQEYLRKWDIGHVVSTLVEDPHTRLFYAISLYRSQRAAAYSEEERSLKQDVMPHLIETWRTNRMAHLMKMREMGASVNSTAALVDRQGLLHLSDDLFAALLHNEWPQWRGPYVPDALLPYLHHATEQQPTDCECGSTLAYVGETLVAKFDPCQDQVIIRLRAKRSYDRLAPRERQVARLFGSGQSQKQVAKALSLAPSTINNYLATIYNKLAIKDKAQLATMVAKFEEA